MLAFMGLRLEFNRDLLREHEALYRKKARAMVIAFFVFSVPFLLGPFWARDRETAWVTFAFGVLTGGTFLGLYWLMTRGLKK